MRKGSWLHKKFYFCITPLPYASKINAKNQTKQQQQQQENTNKKKTSKNLWTSAHLLPKVSEWCTHPLTDTPIHRPPTAATLEKLLLQQLYCRKVLHFLLYFDSLYGNNSARRHANVARTGGRQAGRRRHRHRTQATRHTRPSDCGWSVGRLTRWLVARLAAWLTVLWCVGACCCWGRRLVVSYRVNVLKRSTAYNRCNNNNKTKKSKNFS